MKSGIELIAEERQRQIKKWGTTDAHDILHEDGELAIAATFALTLDSRYSQYGFNEFEKSVRMKTELERRVIAGALIAAEIDRLHRIEK